MLGTKYLTIILLVAMSLSIVPGLAGAQFNPEEPLEGSTGLENTILGCDKTKGILCIISTIVRFMLSLAFVVAMVYVVVSGYRFVTSSGNEEKLSAAKSQLLWAVVGAVIIALSWAVLTFIINIAIEGTVG